MTTFDTSEIKGWEKEYLTMNKVLTARQKELLNGDAIKSHEGMMYGEMHSNWKKCKGYSP